MTINLTQKEQLLLLDQKKHEEICIRKYREYAGQTRDPELKKLFLSYAEEEQQHLDTVNQILDGHVPKLKQGRQRQKQKHQSGGKNQMTMQQINFLHDATLCSDMLMTEKYVASTYNSTIFECTDTGVRLALNHIQKEEQQHGEGIFNYMKSRGMYHT